ncbi:MAG: hypothetical protein VYC82_02435 [Verrucomicrobiota bacterium]|nr:hypothetical protein [Verrucomicrobiota bacterium]
MNSNIRPITNPSSFELQPMTGSLGGEITGLDLTTANDEEMSRIQNALDTYHVLAIRNQSLDPASFQQVSPQVQPL